MATFNVGVIGAGFGTRVHIPALQGIEGVRVTALCSSDAQRGRAAADARGVPIVAPDASTLAARPDVDLIIVASEPARHHDDVMAVLAAGKHVICEKPFALNADQARAMWDGAERAGVRHFINHEFRLHPALQQMYRRLAADEIGRVRHVASSGVTSFARSAQNRLGAWWFDESKGGGWLFASASHRIDSLRFLFGEISSVAASLGRAVERPVTRDGPVNSSVDDSVTALLQFASGAQGVLLSSAVGSGAQRPDRLEAYGDAGALVVSGDQLQAAADGAFTDVELPKLPLRDGDDQLLCLTRLWLGRIIDAIRTDHEVRPTFEDGWRCQAAMDAIRLAARERRWVEVG